MPIALGPAMLIGSAISGGTALAGSALNASATKDAAQLQNEYNMKALADAEKQRAWQQQQYGDYLSRLQPFNQAGQQAAMTLQQRLARGPYVPPAAAIQPRTY